MASPGSVAQELVAPEIPSGVAPRRWTTRRRRRTAVVALAAALALSGCATIPTAGPVHEGDVYVNELDQVYVQQLGPRTGATPLEIVQGFLIEQARGLNDDWATAREYLAAPAADRWDPTVRTTIYTSEPKLVQDEGPPTENPTQVVPGTATTGTGPPDDEVRHAQVSSRVPVSATLDPDGRFTEAAAETQQDLVFSLDRDAEGEWRITGAENGVVVSKTYFETAFRPTSLYFPTLDGKFLVPEVRWYPSTNTAAYAVNGVLAGPSDWLRDSVAVVAPKGTRLTLDSVAVEEGVARVDLSSEVLAAPEATRAMLKAQLEAVLLGPGIQAVDITVGSAPLTIDTTVSPERDPVSSMGAPLVLSVGLVSEIEGGTVVPVAGLQPLTGRNVTALGADQTLDLVVFRQGTTDIVTVPRAGATEQVLFNGVDVLAPSIDRFGWLWTGSGTPGAQLSVVSPAGEVTAVQADWLADRTVDSIQVSRDGARIAVVSTASGTSRIDVAAIVRGSLDGPVRLSDSEIVGAAVPGPSQVVWVDESTLGALADGQTPGAQTVYVVHLSRHSEALGGVDQSLSIASGRGSRAIYLVTEGGDLFTRSATGTTWSLVLRDVRLPTFPG